MRGIDILRDQQSINSLSSALPRRSLAEGHEEPPENRSDCLPLNRKRHAHSSLISISHFNFSNSR